MKFLREEYIYSCVHACIFTSLLQSPEISDTVIIINIMSFIESSNDE